MTCAYCGVAGRLSREHIFPAFLYRQSPSNKFGYNARADKFMTSEATVRDVCATCNNGPLSELDTYARDLLSSVHCDRTYTSRSSVTLDYNYTSLLRWLLKVSYNAARMGPNTPALLKESASFILDPRIEVSTLAFLAVEVVRDTPIPEGQRAFMPEELRSKTHIPQAPWWRVGPKIMPIPNDDADVKRCLRFVAVNAWYFTLCLVEHGTSRALRRRVAAAFRSESPDAVILRPSKSVVRFQVSRRTGFDMYESQSERVQDQWQEYLAQVVARGAI